MDLPGLIRNFFTNLETGILTPLTEGIYGIAPILAFLALVAIVCALIFAKNKGPWVVSLLVVFFVIFFLGDLPTFLTAGIDWFSSGGVSPDAAQGIQDAANATKEGLNHGLNALGD